jgi:hypothetical protein
MDAEWKFLGLGIESEADGESVPERLWKEEISV